MKNEDRESLAFFFAIVVFLLPLEIFSQIMGADISYRYNSLGRYEINLDIFQNCDAAISLPDSFPIQYVASSQGINGILFVYRQIGTEILRPGCQRQATQTRCEGGNGIGVRITRYINNRGIPGFSILPAPDWRFTWTNGTIQVSATLNNSSSNFTSPAFRQNAFEMPHFVCSGETRALPLRIITNGISGSFNLFVDKSLPSFFGQAVPNNGAAAGSSVDNISNLAVSPTAAGTGEILYRMTFPNGSIQRSIIIHSLACNNTPPTISGFDNTSNYTKTTCVAQNITFRLRGSDANNDPIRVIYDPNYKPENQPFFDNSIPGIWVEGQNTSELTFRWDVREGNRHFFVSVYDDACPLPSVGRHIRYDLIVKDTLVAFAGNDTIGVNCNAPLVLNATVRGGETPYSYQWTSPQFLDINGTPQILSTSASLTRNGQLQLGKNGRGTFKVTVTDANGCVAFDSLLVESEFQPRLAFFDSTCTSNQRNFTTVIRDSSLIRSPGSIVSRNWTLQIPGGGTVSSTSSSVAYSYPLGSEGKYLVTLAITANSSISGTCSDILTDTVHIRRLPFQTFIDTSGRCQLADITFTPKDTFDVSSQNRVTMVKRVWHWGEFSFSQNKFLTTESGTGPVTHAFKGEILNPDSTVRITHSDTTYRVRVKSIEKSGCFREDSITVTVRSKPFITIYHTKSQNFKSGSPCDTCDYFFKCNDPIDYLSWKHTGGNAPFRTIYWNNTIIDGRYFRENLNLPDIRKFELEVFQRFGFDSIYQLNEAGEYRLNVIDSYGCTGEDRLRVYYPNVTNFDFDENSPFCGIEPSNSVIKVNAKNTTVGGRDYPYWRVNNHVWHWDFTRNRNDKDSVVFLNTSSNYAQHSYADTVAYQEGYYVVALRTIDTTGCPDWTAKTFMRTFPRKEGVFIDYISKGIVQNPFDSVCPNVSIPLLGPTFVTPDPNQRPLYRWRFTYPLLSRVDSIVTRQPNIERSFADSNWHRIELRIFYNFRLNEFGNVLLNAPQCTTQVYLDSAYVYPGLNPVVFYDGQSEPPSSTRGRCVGEPLTLYGAVNNDPRIHPVRWFWNITYNNNEGISQDTIVLVRDTTYSTVSQDSLRTVIPLSAISPGYRNTLVQLTPDNSFFATLHVEDNKSCLHKVTQLISQEPISRPKIQVEGNCANEPFTFSIEPTSDKFNNFLRTELRSLGGFFAPNNTPFGQSFQFSYPFETVDTVVWRVTGVRCSKSDTLVVRVNPRPTARFRADTVCNGTPTRLDASPSIAATSPIVDYRWLFLHDSTRQTGKIVTKLYSYSDTAFNSLDTMRVRLTVVDERGCRDSVTNRVVVKPGVIAGIINFDSLQASAGKPIAFTNLSSPNATRYILDYGDGFTDTILGYQPTFTRTYIKPGIYTLTQKAFNNFGCSSLAQASVNLKVYLILPNIFNPSSADVCNREFRPMGRGIRRINAFLIYNRWGEKLYEARGDLDESMSILPCNNGEHNTLLFSRGWDGTYKGQEQPMGVYLYYISAETVYGEQIAQQGEVRLIR
ncbi:MAG: PKD domain-containing protein [Cytophagales bacterium]|nr:PKD domain-containing protein [Cytophagales bacterium]MDW8384306.1 PKD domain-containing protein [Flammeovirgaceae bacterium]